jgi:hypothetical protein
MLVDEAALHRFGHFATPGSSEPQYEMGVAGRGIGKGGLRTAMGFFPELWNATVTPQFGIHPVNSWNGGTR